MEWLCVGVFSGNDTSQVTHGRLFLLAGRSPFVPKEQFLS